MIRQIVIHRFRGIRRGVIDDIGKVNLLIGPNNSGKSALLELLYLSGTCGRPVNVMLKNVEGGIYSGVAPIRQDLLGDSPLSRVRLRHGESAVCEGFASLVPGGVLKVVLPDVPEGHPLQTIELSVPLEEGGRIEEFTLDDVNRVAMFGLPPQIGSEFPRADIAPSVFRDKDVHPQETQWYYLWDPALVYRYDREDSLDRFAVWSLKIDGGYTKYNTFFADFNIISTHFKDKFTSWALENIPGWYAKIYESLRCIFPNLPEGTISTESVPGQPERRAGFLNFVDRPSLMIDHFGDGTRHAFKILAGLIPLVESVDEKHPGLFLWEEPELFMHPASLRRLMSEVMRLVAKKPIQVFISTQSLEVLAWLAWYLESDEQDKIDPLQVRTLLLRLDKGKLIISPFLGRALGRWIEFFGDPRMIGEHEKEIFSIIVHQLY